MGNKAVRLLRDVNPSLYAEIHPTMNTIDITKLSYGSGRKVWWKCSKDPSHYWMALVNNRKSGSNCGMCEGLFIVHGVNDMSVLSPQLYAELHPTMNTIDTTTLAISSSKMVWWQCSKEISHYWQAPPYSRTKGTNCAMCSGHYIVHGINDLSVISPTLYDEIHPTMNTIDTKTLSQWSSKRVWWQCSESSLHFWSTTVNKRSKGQGCPHCYRMRNINHI